MDAAAASMRSLSSLVQPQRFLVLQWAHGCHQPEMVMKGGCAHIDLGGKDQFQIRDQLFVPGIKDQLGRTITLHPKTAQALKEELSVADPKSDRIFTYWGDVDAFRLSVRRHAKRVGLKGIRFHEAKHTFVFGLFNAGWSLPEVMEASGSSISTIMVYAHAHKKNLAAKLKAFEFSDTPPPKVDQ